MRLRSSRIEVNMFPFLSVLCSIIGVLMLFVLLVIATRIVDSDAFADPALDAGNDLSRGALTDEEHQRLAEELRQLTAEYESQRQKVQELQLRRNRLRQLLELKRDELEFTAGDGALSGIDISPQWKVEMAPATDVRVTKRPRFVEVQYDTYVIHPDGQRFSVNELPPPDSEYDAAAVPDSPLIQFLERVDRTRADEYLVFLIHPNGSTAFHRIFEFIKRRYPSRQVAGLSRIDAGWEPFSKGWILVEENVGR